MASIMLQILSMSVPYLEELSKEGEYGRKMINQYTRYLALGLSFLYAGGLLSFLEFNNLVLTPGIGFRLFFILSVSTGSMIVMWLGEQISLLGLGSGSSVLIFASIVARLPLDIAKTIDAVQLGTLSVLSALMIACVFLAVGACIVFLEKGERKISIQYARRVIGQRMYGGQSSYIPFKLNVVGVMPAIMASSALNIPTFIAWSLSGRFPILKGVAQALKTNGSLYNILTFAFIVLFSYVYTSLVFNPVDLADNLKKSGGFILGIRPGRQTAEYLYYILTRLGLVGALYLGILVLIPNIMQAVVTMPFVLGGTSLLILVGVALELAAQVESYLIEHRYGSFLPSGRVKGKPL
jgi:preprotein translocase subunit SecY